MVLPGHFQNHNAPALQAQYPKTRAYYQNNDLINLFFSFYLLLFLNCKKSGSFLTALS